MIRDNRVGIIEVSGCLVHDENIDINELLMVFSKLVVLRCEYMFCSDVFKVEAYSPDFDIVPEGIVPPKYRAIFKREEDGNIKISFERYKDE